MSERKYSLLLLEQNKSQKEDDNEYDTKLYKKTVKFKINDFEKFKPKNKVNEQESEKALKGAENQVKSLLSGFLRNIKSDEIDKSDMTLQQFNNFKNTNDFEQNSSQKRNIKNTRTTTYKKFLTKNSNKYNSKLIGNKNEENNNSLINSTPKNIISHKKIKKYFSISSSHKRKKNETQKSKNIAQFKFDDQNINLDKTNSSQVPELNLKSIKNSNNKSKKNSSWNNIKRFLKNSNSINHNRVNIKSLIKKTHTQNNIKDVMNFKNDDFISNNNKEKDKLNKQISSFKNFVNNIKNNLILFNKSKAIQNNIQTISIKPTKSNRKLPEKNSNNKNPFIYKAQRCLSSKAKKSSLFYKQQIQIFNEKNGITSESNEFSKILSLKKIKRSETSGDMNKNVQMENQDKFLNLISNFKTLKHKIKKSIILRPEHQEESNKEIKSIKRIKSLKKKGTTTNKIINLKRMIIEETPNSSNDISRSNTIIFKGNKNADAEKENEKNNTNLEKEETFVSGKQERENSENFQEKFSFHSIKRKNVLHLEKYRIISRKGVIYDSLDDEELEDEEDLNRFYIDPKSKFCFFFDLILFIICEITFFEIPLYLAKNHSFCKAQRFSFNDTINLLNEIMNALDCFFGFFRAFYNWEEQLVKKNDIIAKRYLFGWFSFDLISAIPVYSITKIYEPICDDISQSSYYNFTLDNFHYLFMCNRLLKMLKIYNDNQAWKYISNKLNDFWSLIFSIGLIILGLNYTACLYIFIARNSYPNWILKANLDMAEFKNIYICSIYILLAALTTVGYGDITCSSFPERIFQLFLLIIGIFAYSWIVSSFSNFIKKLNEKYVDLEKKISILDEIKLNNPNLPDELYDRIVRYLKFKHFHEKKLKNIIFDSLPVGLKNNLIFEMYKPIIKNFIFFKNFQNTDFIVQVILSFKSILAFKNYILVNEDDLIEEIIFVKKGVLAVELPINTTNPQENIEKYLSIPLDKEKDKGKSESKKLSKTKSDVLGSFLGDSKPQKLFSLVNSSTINTSINYKASLIKNSSIAKLNPMKAQKVYVRILGIRENEHFGDVLMFLEERSPLRVRVRSKKSELFFLKKIDALKISTAYPNIWRRINKKSVYNFKQIKKNIKKIVEIYCSFKDVDKKTTEENSSYKGFFSKKSNIWIHPKNFDPNNSALYSNKNPFIVKRNKSQEIFRKKNKDIFSKILNINDNYFNEINAKKIIQGIKRVHSFKLSKKKFNSSFELKNQLYENHFSFSDSSSSSNITQNHKCRKNDKKIKKKIGADKKSKQNQILKNNNNNNSIYKDSFNSKAKILNEEGANQKNKEKKEKSKNKKNKVKQSLFGLNEHKINNYEIAKKKENLINFSEDSSEINKDDKINSEISPDELIQFNNTENLLNKKLDNNIQYNIENNFKINANIEQNKNRNLVKLLKLFDEESKTINKNLTLKENSNVKSSNKFLRIVNNSNRLIFNHDNNSSSEIIKNSESSINLKIKTNWDNNLLLIKNDISLTINSSYENYNLISGEKLIKSKALQNKVKEYLINELFNISNKDMKYIKKINSLEQTMKLKEDKKKLINKNLRRRKRLASSIVYNTTNINYINNIHYMKNKPENLIKKSSSLIDKILPNTNETNSEKFSAHFNSLDRKQVNKIRNDIKPFDKEFYGHSTKNTFKFNFNPKFVKKKQNESILGIKSSNNIHSFDVSHNKSFNLADDRIMNDFTSKEIPILPRRNRMKRRHSVLVSSNLSKVRKKKDNLLSLIDYNIQSINQKLNDPDGFYSNYFRNILKEEMKEKNKKKS